MIIRANISPESHKSILIFIILPLRRVNQMQATGRNHSDNGTLPGIGNTIRLLAAQLLVVGIIVASLLAIQAGTASVASEPPAAVEAPAGWRLPPLALAQVCGRRSRGRRQLPPRSPQKGPVLLQQSRPARRLIHRPRHRRRVRLRSPARGAAGKQRLLVKSRHHEPHLPYQGGQPAGAGRNLHRPLPEHRRRRR